jgi:hypothetical protein
LATATNAVGMCTRGPSPPRPTVSTMPTAIGGTLDDWNFAIEILVAAGTVGAVIVALWLGLHAEGEKKRDRLEAARWNARQVISVIRAWIEWEPRGGGVPGQGPGLEIVNGSKEVITDIRADVQMRPLPSGLTGFTWEWTGSAGDRLAYLMPGQHDDLQGEPHDEHGRRVERLETVRSSIVVMISWRDGHGTRWTRSDNSEPAISSAAYSPLPLEPFLDHTNRWQRAWRAARRRARPKSRRDE